VKRRGNVEFIAARELDLTHPLSGKTEPIVDRPIHDTESLFLFESEGCESDDLG